jgi:subtilase family serine protease
MSLRTRTLTSIAALVAVAACSSDNLVPTATTDGPSFNKGQGQIEQYIHSKVCPTSEAGSVRCHAWVRVDPDGKPVQNVAPSGYGPADLQTAYSLPTSGGAGRIIAIVDAYDDPNAEGDLAVYRSKFGLSACTTANGCFRKVNQSGGTTYPRADAGWAEEISLDLDMASAICADCHILLVEATNNSFANLAAAVDRAAQMGANAISNSYGGGEYSGEVADQSHYNHPGIAITVSSGDGGYGVEFPAASQYVTAVGGTHLTKSGGAFTETVWSGAGSGCSLYITKPSWQTDACAKRTVADVSAVADPNTGVAVYDTYGLRRGGGWLVFGGTSVAAPIIASVYALTGNASSLNYGSFSYGHTTSLFDIISGSNGSCGGSYLCTGKTGYDGPTGNGSPRGTGAF